MKLCQACRHRFTAARQNVKRVTREYARRAGKYEGECKISPPAPVNYSNYLNIISVLCQLGAITISLCCKAACITVGKLRIEQFSVLS